MCRDSKSALFRAAALAALTGICLAGCTSTSGMSSHDDLGDPASLLALGVDNFGNQIGAAWPSIPQSNQVSLKGDQSRRYLQLGKENFRNANFGTAERYFRKAVEIRPDSTGAWMGLAASYDQLGRFDLADRAYDALAKLRNGDARIINNRGYSYLLRGDYAKAEEYLKKAQSIDPSLVEVDGNLQLLEEVINS